MQLRRAIASIGVCILLLPFFVFSSETDLKTQVADLRTQLLQLQELLNALKAMKQAPVAQSTTGACHLGNRTLMIGMRGEDVRCLQTLLSRDSSIYPEKIVSGYFGPLTQKAVERYQSKIGIVFAGSATTTGFGAVGAKTRIAILGRYVSAIDVGVPSMGGFDGGDSDEEEP